MDDRLKLMLDYARDFEMILRDQRERVVDMMSLPFTWLLSGVSFLIGAVVVSQDWYAEIQRISIGMFLFAAVSWLLAAFIYRYAGRVANFNRNIADRVSNLRRLTIETEDETKFRELFDLILTKYDEGYNRMWRGWMKEPEGQPTGWAETLRFIKEGK